jgi:glycosyltransferase involved in cell wall biosynthesis
MKVLMLIDSLRLGGAERVLATLSAVAPSAGFRFEVQVLSPPDRQRSVMEPVLEQAGVSIGYLSLRRLTDPRALPRLVRAIRRSRCEVVHAHLEDAATWAPIAGGIVGRPVVCSFHHVVVPLGRRESVREWLAIKAANRGAGVVFVSRASMDSFAEAYGGERPNWSVVNNGIDLTAFSAQPASMPVDLGLPRGARVATIVGALRGRKGHAVALTAWPEVLARFPDAHLLIAGEGPEKARLRTLAHELGIAERVVFAGIRSDIAELIRASSLVLLPSQHEALPTALIEAAACGRPVVSTDVDGVPEVVVDGETGVLVPVDDATAFADAVCMLLGDDRLRLRMGSQARQLAEERFDARSWAEHLYDVYAQACGMRHAMDLQYAD